MYRRIFTLVLILLVLKLSAQKGIYAPALSEPEDNAANQSAQVLLKWNAVAGAYYYKLQIDTINPNSNLKEIKIINATTYTVKNLVFGKVYYWRLKSFSVNMNTGVTTDSSGWSKTSTFTVINTVILNKPLNNAVTQTLPLAISWNAITGVNGYSYQVDITPLFNSLYLISGVINQVGTSAPATKADLKTLQTGTAYYWRVKARNGASMSDWSEIRNFTTILNVSDAPDIIRPVNGSTVPPQFTAMWNPLQNATSYLSQVDKTDDFAVGKIDTVKTLMLKYDKLFYGKKYYWRMKGMGVNNISSWSVPVVFYVVDKPKGILPAEGAENQINNKLVIKWDSLPGSTNYQCQVDTSALFNNPVKNINTKNASTTASSLILLKTYYWRVRANHSLDTSDWSPVYSFKTYNGHIASPELTSPSDNSINQSIKPKLVWSGVTGATGYKFQVDTAVNFLKPRINKSTEVTNYTIPDSLKLLYGNKYYWRVKAVKTSSPADESDWSEPFAFNTVYSVGQTPVLYFPQNSSTDQMPDVQLLWSQFADANKYIVEISTDNVFSSPVSQAVSDNKFSTSGLSFGAIYFWRVKAMNATDTTLWSEVFSFKVIGSPAILSPENNSYNLPIKNLTVKWNKITGITGYRLQLSQTAGFATPVIDKELTDTFNIFNNLNFDSKYYLRVYAYHANDTSLWSKVDSINTIARTRILYPVNNSANIMSGIFLEIIPLEGATDYDFLLDISPDFNTTTLIKDSTFGLTRFKINYLMFGTKYYLKVRGRNSYTVSDWSDAVVFNTINKVKLFSPANGAVAQMPNAKLNWENINGITQYNYEIDNTTQFTSPNVIKGTAVNNILIPDTFRFGTKYYWRIQAQNNNIKNINNRSEFSEAWSFTVLDTVTRISPVNNYQSNSASVVFKWKKITGLQNYAIEYSQSDTFALATTATVAANLDNYTAKNLKSGKWYWRIKAVSRAGSSSWTDGRAFTVKLNGIDDMLADNGMIDIYPVPANDRVYVRFSEAAAREIGKSSDTDVKITLVNILGQELLAENADIKAGDLTKELKVNGLDNGIYFIKLENNKSFSTRQIIIAR